MPSPIDHFVWGTPDLAEGCAYIEKEFGIAPEPGGTHPGLGTCNALLSLGADQYLEIMAPKDPPPQSVGARLATLPEPGLVTWVVRRSDLSQLADKIEQHAFGIARSGPVKTERLTPAGDLLSWELLFLTGHPYAGLLPFFIDWQDTPHPSRSKPLGGAVVDFSIQSRSATSLNPILSGLDTTETAIVADADALALRIRAPAGAVELNSTPQTISILGM